MAPSVQVFVQVALLFHVVTTSMGGITDLQKSFAEEETKSLHQKIEQLEKRLEQLAIEVKGEFVEVQTQSTVPTLHAC